jgi:hypothetical protein
VNAGALRGAIRIVRLASFVCALGAALLVSIAYRPQFESARAALSGAELQLRSGEIAAAQTAELQRRRRDLAARYSAAFGGHVQARFLRELARTLKRHRAALTASAAAPAAAAAGGGNAYRSAFAATRLSLELRGTYRDLVTVIGELSYGTELVRVEAPSFHLAGNLLGAVVPVNVYDPARSAPAGGENRL